MSARVFNFLLLMLLLLPAVMYAQKDSSGKKDKVDSLLSNQKGLLGELAQNLLTDTAEPVSRDVQRVDKNYQRYQNRIIRRITIKPLDFGVNIGDTTKKLNDRLTRLANSMHKTTKPFVVRNQLFFRENEKLSAFLLANNERYLRDLPFLQDARFIIRPVRGHPDSVDITVLVKDVLSIGGDISVRSAKSANLEIKEDNFMGYGDRLQFQTLFDRERRPKFGYGGAYRKRNILGTFMDAYVGYLDFFPAFNTGKREECNAFIQLIRPLVNPRSKWTYAASAEWHRTSNRFNTDSIYRMDYQYSYRLYDGWVGWNPSWKNIGKKNEAQQLRYLIGLRAMHQKFTDKPVLYKGVYNYNYAEVKAVLASLSVYRQNFYKTQYIYGFGRNEDLPQGIDAGVTAGFTHKDSTSRPYLGLNWNLNYITEHQRFLNFAIAAGSSFYRGRAEDVSLMATGEYFGRLHQFGAWKQRLYVNMHAARQMRGRLDEPLFLESAYALPDFDNLYDPGHTRAGVEGVWIFYAPRTLLFFKFAPFVAGSMTWFDSRAKEGKLIPMLGGGLRIRNESLIFGTIELRGNYFLRADETNTRMVIQLRSNLRYKYNQNFIRRPSFVKVN